MGYRYDDSYPFFHLAQRRGIPYEDVLNYADLAERLIDGKIDTSRDPTPEQMAIVARIDMDAAQEICDLVRLPVHERGGRHDA